MAWIIGIVTADELTSLRQRGWEDCDPPEQMLGEDEQRGVADASVTRAFFVDNDVFSIMSGPDWDMSEVSDG